MLQLCYNIVNNIVNNIVFLINFPFKICAIKGIFFWKIYWILKNVFFPLIRDSCDYVCPYTKPCDGHNFLDFIEKTLSIRTKCRFREKNVIFEIFISTTFVFKRDEVHGMEKVCGWVFRFLLSGMKLLILASVLAFILCCDTRH